MKQAVLEVDLLPRRLGRRPTGCAMTPAERQAARRGRQKEEKDAADKRLKELEDEVKRQGKLINDLLEEIARLRDSNKPSKPTDYKHSELDSALLA